MVLGFVRGVCSFGGVRFFFLVWGGGTMDGEECCLGGRGECLWFCCERDAGMFPVLIPFRYS